MLRLISVSMKECEIKHHQLLPTMLIFNDTVSRTIAAIIQRVFTPLSWKGHVQYPMENSGFMLADQRLPYTLAPETQRWPSRDTHLCATAPVIQQQLIINYEQDLQASVTAVKPYLEDLQYKF